MTEINQFITRALVETGSYQDLEKPVIFTSGEIGIFYCSTDKLCGDKNAINTLGNNAHKLVNHAIKLTRTNKTFHRIIQILTQKAEPLLPFDNACAIAGGQRKDWIFSGPTAHNLGLPHLAIYKNRHIELSHTTKDSITTPQPFTNLNQTYVLPIVDIVNEGSSIYRIEDKQEKGWVPWLRAKGANITDIITVVNRKQGGEEILAQQGITLHTLATIDQQFLKTHSKNPEQTCAYYSNPKTWNENYLKNNGALALIEYFNPKGEKIDRAIKFIQRYKTILEQAGKLEELKTAVQQKYNTTLDQITTQ